MPDADGPQKPEYDQLAEAWMLGLMFPLSIVAGFLAGWGVDHFFATGSWGRIIGTGLGIAAAFINLFRVGLRNDGTGT